MEALSYPMSIEKDKSICVTFVAHSMATKDILEYSGKRAFGGSGKDKVENTSNLSAQGSITLALPSSTLTESFSSNWNIGNMASGFNDSAIGQASQILAGAIVPPVYKAIYTDSTPRTYSFTFSFLPQNQQETNTAVKIIKTFKQWASSGNFTSSEGGGEGYMDKIIPYVLSVNFTEGAQKLQELIVPNYCIIENITVNYFDNGQITAYHDGMPKSTSLTLSLKEITVPMREDFKDKK